MPISKNRYLNSVLPILEGSDHVELEVIEVSAEVSPVEPGLSEGVVGESEEGGSVIINFVTEEQVILDEDVAGDPIGSEDSEGELVLGDHGSVVPGDVFVIAVEVNLESVVGVAGASEVGRSESQADVLKALGGVEASVEVPLLAPVFSDSVVELKLEVVGGLDLRVEGSTLRKIEPQLDLITHTSSSLILTDRHLDVGSAASSLCVDLEDGELVVHEIVADEGEGESGEVSPGIDLN